MSEQPPNFPPPERPTAQQPAIGQQPEFGQQQPAGPPSFGPPTGPPQFGPDLGGPFDGPPPTRASFARRNRTPLIVAAAVVVLGGAGAGIAVAATSDSTTTASPGSSSSSVPGQGQPTSGSNAPGKGKQGKNGAKQHPTRATIVSEATSTWTVRTKAGASMTITINSDTQFGTKKAPATRTQFTVGKQIAIVGPKTGTAIIAKRIKFPQQKASGATPSPSTASGTPS